MDWEFRAQRGQSSVSGNNAATVKSKRIREPRTKSNLLLHAQSERNERQRERERQLAVMKLQRVLPARLKVLQWRRQLRISATARLRDILLLKSLLPEGTIFALVSLLPVVQEHLWSEPTSLPTELLELVVESLECKDSSKNLECINIPVDTKSPPINYRILSHLVSYICEGLWSKEDCRYISKNSWFFVTVRLLYQVTIPRSSPRVIAQAMVFTSKSLRLKVSTNATSLTYASLETFLLSYLPSDVLVHNTAFSLQKFVYDSSIRHADLAKLFILCLRRLDLEHHLGPPSLTRTFAFDKFVKEALSLPDIVVALSSTILSILQSEEEEIVADNHQDNLHKTYSCLLHIDWFAVAKTISMDTLPGTLIALQPSQTDLSADIVSKNSFETQTPRAQQIALTAANALSIALLGQLMECMTLPRLLPFIPSPSDTTKAGDPFVHQKRLYQIFMARSAFYMRGNKMEQALSDCERAVIILSQLEAYKEVSLVERKHLQTLGIETLELRGMILQAMDRSCDAIAIWKALVSKGSKQLGLSKWKRLKERVDIYEQKQRAHWQRRIFQPVQGQITTQIARGRSSSHDENPTSAEEKELTKSAKRRLRRKLRANNKSEQALDDLGSQVDFPAPLGQSKQISTTLFKSANSVNEDSQLLDAETFEKTIIDAEDESGVLFSASVPPPHPCTTRATSDPSSTSHRRGPARKQRIGAMSGSGGLAFFVSHEELQAKYKSNPAQENIMNAEAKAIELAAEQKLRLQRRVAADATSSISLTPLAMTAGKLSVSSPKTKSDFKPLTLTAGAQESQSEALKASAEPAEHTTESTKHLFVGVSVDGAVMLDQKHNIEGDLSVGLERHPVQTNKTWSQIGNQQLTPPVDLRQDLKTSMQMEKSDSSDQILPATGNLNNHFTAPEDGVSISGLPETFYSSLKNLTFSSSDRGDTQDSASAKKRQRITAVLDGANIGYFHGRYKVAGQAGKKKRHFSTLGLRIALEFYNGPLDRTSDDDTSEGGEWCAVAFLPQRFLESRYKENLADNINMLQLLVDKKVVHLTPAGADDDHFMIKFAARHGCRIVTNDNFADHLSRLGKIALSAQPGNQDSTSQSNTLSPSPLYVQKQHDTDEDRSNITVVLRTTIKYMFINDEFLPLS